MIYAVVNTTHEKHKRDKVLESHNIQKPIWKNATSDQRLEFNDAVFRKLRDLVVNDDLISCKKLHCSDAVHFENIDKFADELFGLVNNAAFECIPVSRKKRKTTTSKKSTPGWKQFVEPMQDTAKFWYTVWLSAGKPVNTELHRIMKTTRNQFHYQIRRVKRVEEYLKNCKLAQNAVENDLDLFSEKKGVESIKMKMR